MERDLLLRDAMVRDLSWLWAVRIGRLRGLAGLLGDGELLVGSEGGELLVGYEGGEVGALAAAARDDGEVGHCCGCLIWMVEGSEAVLEGEGGFYRARYWRPRVWFLPLSGYFVNVQTCVLAWGLVCPGESPRSVKYPRRHARKRNCIIGRLC